MVPFWVCVFTGQRLVIGIGGRQIEMQTQAGGCLAILFGQRDLILIVGGFLGVFIIVKPGYEVVNLASLIVLGAAMCYSISHACTKSLSATEHPFTILFMMCVIQLPIGFVLALPSWKMPVGTQWNWLLLIGVTALSAHFCMTKAMQYADVTSVVIMDFFRLPAIAVVGVLLYNEQFEWSLLLGALLMLLGNVAAMSKLKAGNKIESEITEVRANKTKRK